MTECEILDMLPSIHWAILCYEYGKLDDFIASGNSGPHSEYYQCFWDTLQFASDFLHCDYLEDYEAQKYYFGFESMSEYYRLCRDYCVQRGVRLKDNPYMIEAERFVENAMDFGMGSYGGYSFLLQTKINHKWASGLLVFTDECNFRSEFELTEAILSIGAWYKEAVKRLKNDLQSYVPEEKEVLLHAA